MNQFISIAKALGDENRARSVMALAQGELCLCEIVEVLGLSPSTVSRHVSLLQEAGLVERRKEGRWHYFRLAGRSASPTVRQAIRWTLKSLEGEKIVVNDALALQCVRETDRGELAACYKTN